MALAMAYAVLACVVMAQPTLFRSLCSHWRI
jgi:hypothetical protein